MSRPHFLRLISALAASIICVAALAHGLLFASSRAAFQEPYKIIQQEGRFIFTDGSSYYLLEKGGRFKSAPLGMSGREITGTWKLEEQKFVVEGQWGWINGASPTDDYRRLTFFVSTPMSVETVKSFPLAGAKIYKCYFLIDELQKMPRQ